MTREVPTIDLEAARAGDPDGLLSAAEQIGYAGATSGFFAVTGHGIPSATSVSLRDAARALFADAESSASCPLRSDAYRGVAPLASEALATTIGADSPPDLRELFNIGPLEAPEGVPQRYASHFAENSWPEPAPGLRAAMERYYACAVGVTELMTRLFSLALGLDEHELATRWAPHATNLTVSRYPSVVERPPIAGQLWAGPHTDFGTFTLVDRDPGWGGLQIESDGVWSDVPLVPGSLTVNIGDMLQRWTNDRWRSTMHRVVPSTDPRDETDRLSIVTFHNPSPMSIIDTLPTCVDELHPARYAPISAGAHFEGKVGLQRDSVEI